MDTQLLLIIFRLIRDQLSAEIENVKKGLPDSYGKEEGKGSFLDPHVTVYPILNGLYSVSTNIDNVVFALEKQIEDSQE